MSPKVFLGLAALTVITTVVAVLAVLSQPAVTTLQLVDEPAFPALREDPDAVAKVTLTTPEGTITLVRETGDRWAALERYGYPVDRKRMRDLVVALADMRLIERKTAQPERYDRLQVEPPDAEKAQSTLVRLEAADGAVLAEAIIGKQRYRLTGTEPAGTYMRRPDEAQSWLASGGVQIEPAVARWLDSEIVDLDPAAIRRIVIERAGEPGYVAARDQPENELRLVALAADETLKEDADLGQLSGALSSLRFEDVRPRDQLTWPTGQNVARIQTFDGVELTVRLAKIGEEYWATFDARAVAPAPGAAPAAQPPAEGTAAGAGQEGKLSAAAAEPASAGTDGERTAESGQEPREQAGAQEASQNEPAEEKPAPIDPDQLNQRLRKWAYRIPEYLFNRLSTARSELAQAQGDTS